MTVSDQRLSPSTAVRLQEKSLTVPLADGADLQARGRQLAREFGASHEDSGTAEDSRANNWTRDTIGDPTPRWERRNDLVAVSGLQKWEGRIVSVGDALFTVELTRVEESQPLTLLADFELALLGTEEEVAPGDVVYITARFVERGRGLPPTKTLSARLRRVGNWTLADVAQAKHVAKQRLLDIEDLID